MTDLIVIAVLAVIIVLAARYLYKAKKNGAVCVAVPPEAAAAVLRTILKVQAVIAAAPVVAINITNRTTAIWTVPA